MSNRPSAALGVTQSLEMLDILLEPLEAEAIARGTTAFELAKAYLAPGVLHISPEQAMKIRHLLGGSIDSGTKLLDMIRRLKSIKLANRSVEFSASRLEALEYKARAMGMTLDEALPQIMDMALGAYLGA
jgi:hypothetical protein